MPILPLLHTPADPDAWHRVIAPGGYERWYFDAEDESGRFRLVAVFLEGPVFHPGYLRRYHRYRRRPTRVAPPQAREYPCVYCAVYEDGRVISRSTTQYRMEDFSASADRPDVRIGPNGFRREPDGSLRVQLRQQISAELVFRPLFNHAPLQRRLLSEEVSDADHHWVIANPLCRVEGTIRGGSGTAIARDISFAGRGYHDHNYGTAPFGPGLRCWMWGRVLMDDMVVTFHVATPRDRALGQEVHVIEHNSYAIKEVVRARVKIDRSRRSGAALAYPAEVRIPGVGLSHPRVVDSGSFFVRLLYDAELHVCRPGTMEGEARTATAFGELVYPRRLTWPVLGRVIEKSIQLPALDAHGVAPESPLC